MSLLQRALPLLLFCFLVGAPQSYAKPPEATVRALVFEYADKWTDGATGAARLLRDAGAVVTSLDLDRRAPDLGADLVVFGSFANNDKRYREFTTKHAADLRGFVAQGGVILVMTQSDQYGRSEVFLPPDLAARRIDKDLARVVTQVDAHPLLEGWAPPRGEQLKVPSYKNNELNWESFFDWRGFRVLMASHPGPAYPALLEGAHGKGRILLTSLWLDKVFDQDGKAIVPEAGVTAGRQFFKALSNYVRLVRSGRAIEVASTPAPVPPPTGPILGHIDAKQALVWFRPSGGGHYELVVTEVSTQRQTRLLGEAREEDDLCLTWRVKDLKADTDYSYRIVRGGEVVIGGDKYRFRTAPPPEDPARVSLAIGSCASSTKHRSIWQRMATEEVDGVVLLGDTPYINSSDPAVNRHKHREFLQFPALAALGAQVPFWASWDDHDFGGNDTDGNMPGKETIRKVFIEYRALDSFGEDEKGIYTKFRRGPLEVFLLDARYFAQTGPSPVDPDKPTCLGKRQWEWLLENLKASTAPFKVLATGMIWDDKTNSEKDDWHTYRHERDALFDFIGREKIGGVILVGGDIHCCRALRYETEERIGYPLWQFISSPLHERVIESLNVPHPDLVFGKASKNVFLKLTADSTREPATLEAVFIRKTGERLFEVELNAQQLSPLR